MLTTLPLDQLIADPAIHPRTRIRQRAIRQYAASYREGDTLPPLDAFQSPDGRIFLADGFHRYYGARAAGRADIAVELFEGDVREATRFACGANARHGVPRTREDKCFEIAAMLLEPEFAGATDLEISKTCRVSRQLIAKVRPKATEQEAFRKFMDEETERRTLAREDRQIARKKARKEAQAAAAAAPPAPPPAVPDRPLSPQEEAMAALARAAEAADLARKAMAECERAYPEANRFEAMIAICEAQIQLDELVPPVDSPTLQGASNEQMLALLKEVQLQTQPEKLHASSSFPAPSHSLGGLETGAEALAPPDNPKSYTSLPQLEKLQPEFRQLPSDQLEKFQAALQPEKLHLSWRDLPADLFAPKPLHPMIADTVHRSIASSAGLHRLGHRFVVPRRTTEPEQLALAPHTDRSVFRIDALPQVIPRSGQLFFNQSSSILSRPTSGWTDAVPRRSAKISAARSKSSLRQFAIWVGCTPNLADSCNSDWSPLAAASATFAR